MFRRYWAWLVKEEARPTRLFYVPLRAQLALWAVFGLGGVAIGAAIAGLASWSLSAGSVIGLIAGLVAGNVVGVAAKVAGRER